MSLPCGPDLTIRGPLMVGYPSSPSWITTVSRFGWYLVRPYFSRGSMPASLTRNVILRFTWALSMSYCTVMVSPPDGPVPPRFLRTRGHRRLSDSCELPSYAQDGPLGTLHNLVSVHRAPEAVTVRVHGLDLDFGAPVDILADGLDGAPRGIADVVLGLGLSEQVEQLRPLLVPGIQGALRGDAFGGTELLSDDLLESAHVHRRVQQSIRDAPPLLGVLVGQFQRLAGLLDGQAGVHGVLDTPTADRLAEVVSAGVLTHGAQRSNGHRQRPAAVVAGVHQEPQLHGVPAVDHDALRQLPGHERLAAVEQDAARDRVGGGHVYQGIAEGQEAVPVGEHLVRRTGGTEDLVGAGDGVNTHDLAGAIVGDDLDRVAGGIPANGRALFQIDGVVGAGRHQQLLRAGGPVEDRAQLVPGRRPDGSEAAHGLVDAVCHGSLAGVDSGAPVLHGRVTGRVVALECRSGPLVGHGRSFLFPMVPVR